MCVETSGGRSQSARELRVRLGHSGGEGRLAPKHRVREEVINVQLAQALAARGLDAVGETISRRGRPDVLVSLDGVKLIIEGRARDAQPSLFHDARRRVENGMADISMAVLYPDPLYEISEHEDLARRLVTEEFDGAVYYYGPQGIVEHPFQQVTLQDLGETINAVFDLRVRNDVVREQVANLENTIEAVVGRASATRSFRGSRSLVRKLRAALGVDDDGAQEAE